MKVKFIIIGMVLILAFSLLQTVTSFTKAEINNDASIKITNQENALISVIPEERSVSLTPEESSEVTINVSNRVNHAIKLKGASDTIDGITYSYESASFKKGETKPIQLKLGSDKQIADQGGPELIHIPLEFDWEAGEAIIPAEIDIALEEEDAEDEKEEGTGETNKVTEDKEATQNNKDKQEEAVQDEESLLNNENTKEESIPEEENPNKTNHENEEEGK